MFTSKWKKFFKKEVRWITSICSDEWDVQVHRDVNIWSLLYSNNNMWRERVHALFLSFKVILKFFLVFQSDAFKDALTFQPAPDLPRSFFWNVLVDLIRSILIDEQEEKWVYNLMKSKRVRHQINVTSEHLKQNSWSDALQLQLDGGEAVDSDWHFFFFISLVVVVVLALIPQQGGGGWASPRRPPTLQRETETPSCKSACVYLLSRAFGFDCCPTDENI